jgi:hypothetical protein
VSAVFQSPNPSVSSAHGDCIETGGSRGELVAERNARGGGSRSDLVDWMDLVGDGDLSAVAVFHGEPHGSSMLVGDSNCHVVVRPRHSSYVRVSPRRMSSFRGHSFRGLRRLDSPWRAAPLGRYFAGVICQISGCDRGYLYVASCGVCKRWRLSKWWTRLFRQSKGVPRAGIVSHDGRLDLPRELCYAAWPLEDALH